MPEVPLGSYESNDPACLQARIQLLVIAWYIICKVDSLGTLRTLRTCSAVGFKRDGNMQKDQKGLCQLHIFAWETRFT